MEELAAIPAPQPTATWFPVSHAQVLEVVRGALTGAGFETSATKLTLIRSEKARMFAILDLATELCDGITLAVGVRNSTDKSFPLSFCAGLRVAATNHLAFSSELRVSRKHTKLGQNRFREETRAAIRSLGEFRADESRRVERLKRTAITDERAESIMLRSFERRIISTRTLPKLIREWRRVPGEAPAVRTYWDLFRVYILVLQALEKTNPQKFALGTMALMPLLQIDGDA